MNLRPNHRIVREKGSFISHVATLVTGTAISQAITFGAMLVLTRLFAPDAFGLLAVFMTIVSLFSVLGGARYELAIMLPEEDRVAANVFHAATLVLIGICLLALCWSLHFFHARLAAILGEPLVESWLWAIPAVLFVSGFYQVLGYWCGRMKRFRHVAVSRIAQSVGTVAMQIALFLAHANGGVALIGGWIFGQISRSCCLTRYKSSVRMAHFSGTVGMCGRFRTCFARTEIFRSTKRRIASFRTVPRSWSSL